MSLRLTTYTVPNIESHVFIPNVPCRPWPGMCQPLHYLHLSLHNEVISKCPFPDWPQIRCDLRDHQVRLHPPVRHRDMYLHLYEPHQWRHHLCHRPAWDNGRDHRRQQEGTGGSCDSSSVSFNFYEAFGNCIVSPPPPEWAVVVCHVTTIYWSHNRTQFILMLKNGPWRLSILKTAFCETYFHIVFWCVNTDSLV